MRLLACGIVATLLIALGAGRPSAAFAGEQADFNLGANAAKESCRAVARFDPPSGGDAADIYCGAWEDPSGRVILYPTADAARTALAQVCSGAATPLNGGGFSALTQVACVRTEQGGPVRYTLVARRGSDVIIGDVFPSDWAPLVNAAKVLAGIEPASAIAGPSAGEPPGLREIEAVFPAGPPGQAAMANYELLLRRAYEYNTIWSFDTSERDFEELLRAHNKLEPDDTSGEAEIFADIALNMSNARRFDEAADAFTKAVSLLQMPKDALLASKVLNYRALDQLNRRDYAGALRSAMQANQARADIAKAAQSATSATISEGDVGRVERGNADAADRRSLLISLSEAPSTDRATILSAQGYYVAAISARALGHTDEASFLNAASMELNQVVTPPGWLVEDISNELADSRYVAGDFAGAAAAAEAGLKLIKTTEPGTRAEAHLWLSLEQAQTRLGQTDTALASGRQAMVIFGQQTEAPGLPTDIAAPHLSLLEQEWRRTHDAKLADEYFKTLSLVWDSAAARTTAQLAARMTLGASGATARAYQDAQRGYRAALARQQLLTQTANTPLDKAADAEAAVRDAAKTLTLAEDTLRAQAPSYLELLNPQADATDLAAVLDANEAYLRIAVGAQGSYAVLVTKTGVLPYRIALTAPQIDALTDRFRRTTHLKGRSLPDFDVAASSDLYAGLIAPIADRLADVRDLDIDVSGSLASIPFAALVTAPPDQATLNHIHDSQDYSGVAWLERRVSVANALGPAALIRLRRAPGSPPSNLSATIYGDYKPDPKAVAARLAESNALSDGCRNQVQHALDLLGPLPETADEAAGIAAKFKDARLVLGASFTDVDFLTNPTTANADVIVLATHGVLGLSTCFPEPALLTSLGSTGDGLIDASQLLDRQLKAQLVVLSACDTAAGDKLDEAETGLGDGGDALSGLARGFIYAGARNVLATQWKVDANASSAEMAAFLGAANQPGIGLGDALASAQRKLFGQAETAHPFYWAAFVLVGDGERRLEPS